MVQLDLQGTDNDIWTIIGKYSNVIRYATGCGQSVGVQAIKNKMLGRMSGVLWGGRGMISGRQSYQYKG